MNEKTGIFINRSYKIRTKTKKFNKGVMALFPKFI